MEGRWSRAKSMACALTAPGTASLKPVAGMAAVMATGLYSMAAVMAATASTMTAVMATGASTTTAAGASATTAFAIDEAIPTFKGEQQACH
jgi:hypothetical protein